MASFFGLDLERHLGKEGHLMKISKLIKWKKTFNKLISKSWFRIEQCFGTLKRRFCFTRASYYGREKEAAQFLLKAMCLNLLKAVNKVKFT